MDIKTSEIVSLLKNLTAPEKCVGELTIALRLNVPGTDIYVDAAVINVPVIEDNGEARFDALPHRCEWALAQLDAAGYYIEDASDIVTQGPDLCTVFINRRV